MMWIALAGVVLGAELSDFAEDAPFEVTFAAEEKKSAVGEACLWWEMDVGDRGPVTPESNGWRTWSHIWTEGGPFVLSTPRGELAMDDQKLRFHIAPALEETWRRDTKRIPEEAKDHYFGDREVLSAVEYRLVAGQTYYARVDVETYHLPPHGPGEKPREGRNTVLMVSDKPFVDGKPQVPLTLHASARTY
jgi:hypothetical protein